MKFIQDIRISRFRSIQEAYLGDLSDFSVIAGLNNSGKSNFLRAIYFFFTGLVEPDLQFKFSRDYFRPELSSKKKKRISIEMSFSLPDSFKFRTDLKPVEKLVGQSFKLKREWAPDGGSSIYLNHAAAPLSIADAQKIETFLRLISVRYIPNRVIPTVLIAREHEALRDVLVRRLAKLQGQSKSLFNAIEKTSKELMTDVASELRVAAPDLTGISLSTAASLADLAFRFGYLLSEGDTETTEEEQGSGIQSFLMFRTLSMIDQDFFKQFGWKQSALWLVEEPESSLHTALEAQIAFFLSKLASRPVSRLQAIATTHSDLMVQYSSQSYVVKKERVSEGRNELKSVAHQRDKKHLLKEAAQSGISRWVNPILLYPLDTVVLVEGKQDVAFLDAAHRALNVVPTYQVVALASLLDDPVKGGVDFLYNFLKKNKEAVKSRSPQAKVVVLLDWDAAGKLGMFTALFKPADPFLAMAWDENDANPKLEKSFRGIERFMSTSLIDKADTQCGGVIGKKANGHYNVSPEDLSKLKTRTYELALLGVTAEDASYAKGIIAKLKAISTN